jgi:hypothetical protein
MGNPGNDKDEKIWNKERIKQRQEKIVVFIMSLSQNLLAQIIKYWIIRKAAKQRTVANNTKDTFACPLT